eukprot:scaffold607307_cov18-Prasinocladus_malaysianus.AAC.1
MDGWRDRQMDEKRDGWIARTIYRQTDTQVDRLTETWKDRWIYGQIDASECFQLQMHETPDI